MASNIWQMCETMWGDKDSTSTRTQRLSARVKFSHFITYIIVGSLVHCILVPHYRFVLEPWPSRHGYLVFSDAQVKSRGSEHNSLNVGRWTARQKYQAYVSCVLACVESATGAYMIPQIYQLWKLYYILSVSSSSLYKMGPIIDTRD